MTFLQQVQDTAPNRGRDLLERLADENGWHLEHRLNGDMVMETTGDHGTYAIQFSWSAEYQSLHITCSMDLCLPISNGAQIHDLLASINSKLWIGHFAVMAGGNQPAFRQTVLMIGPDEAKAQEIQEIIETAVGECNRFYPAFQFAGINGMPGHDAMTCALMECVGEA